MEAVVWTWLTLAYSYPKLVTTLAELLNVLEAEAQANLGALLQGWQAASLLHVQEIDNG